VAQQQLQRTLSLQDGIGLAIGSIAGSGILYLPSLTYVLAGHDVLLVWLGGTLLCIPMLFMFTNMIRLISDGKGIKGFIARGLGEHIASTVPVLFLSVVVLGIPSGVLVAGEYLRTALGGGWLTQFIGAFIILVITIITNLVGATIGARLQRWITWALIIIIVMLCTISYTHRHNNYTAVTPVFHAPGPILSGIVVAFWAYAGFENLTFIAGEFRHPQRDFPIVMIIAFLIYGGLAIALTIIIAALIPYNQVNSLSGLLQLAKLISPTWLTMGIIVVFAFMIMQLSATSWLWGMSRLIYNSATKGQLPGWFAHLNHRGLPIRAIIFLSIFFIVITAITLIFPDLLVTALTIASSVFLFLYVLCLLSYLRRERGIGKRIFYGVLLIFLITTLASVGLKILYPCTFFLVALLVSIIREKRQIANRQKALPKQQEQEEYDISASDY